MSKLNSQASSIQGKLNDIAETLYDASTITDKVVFLVTDSEQTFDDYTTQMEFKVNDNIYYTPVLVKRVLATKENDHTYGKFLESYTLDVLAYSDNKLSIEKIFDALSDQENESNFEVVNSEQTKKIHGKLIFRQTINAGSGKNRHYLYYTYDYSISTVLGSVISDSSTISIDGTEIDFISLSFQNDKVQIPNIAYGTNTNLLSTNGRVIGLTLPIVKTGNQATKNQELFDDITLARYNKAYTLSWQIDGYKTVSLPVVVRSGSVNYNNDELISFVVIFEQQFSRTTLTIDGVSVPVTSLTFNRDYNIESIVQAEELGSVGVSSGVTIRATIAHDHLIAKSREVLSDIINNNIGTEYTIALTIGSNIPELSITQITHSDDYIIKGGTYSYQQTGELLYEVIFVKGVE
jgi:hypothetical protein